MAIFDIGCEWKPLVLNVVLLYKFRPGLQLKSGLIHQEALRNRNL